MHKYNCSKKKEDRGDIAEFLLLIFSTSFFVFFGLFLFFTCLNWALNANTVKLIASISLGLSMTSLMLTFASFLCIKC